MAVHTPLAPDKLLLVGFTGQEALSQLFTFQLDLLAENKDDIPFDQLLGQPMTVDLELPGHKKRYFHGIVRRFSQGHPDSTFTAYRAEVVPQLWLLTRRVQSRIFQHLNVPDILKQVLEGLAVTYEIQGTFHPRDYCVQYRESDFAFASRLMEEEGIYYFFKHTADGHQLVVANTPFSHPDLPEQRKVIFERMTGGTRPEDRVLEWEKFQELRSGKLTLWDHCFELPHQHLDAEKPIQDTVAVGKVTHKLKVGGNDRLEIYDYPGGYAQRFDGIDKGGGAKPADLQKIFEDNQRTVAIRMQQEALSSLEIRGAGNCRHFVSGHKFTLERHGSADGEYVLTRTKHLARLTGNYRTGQTNFSYENTFTCIPLALPFRPPRVTPRPVVQGPQTAVVVGPKGEEIYTDPYGRIKVQFHWDRTGQMDENSSCWVRIAQDWAGKTWGMISIPRIGQEVVVDFLEGDPDQPLVTGRVYNAEQMPPFALPGQKMVSGWKSNSYPGGGGYNEISFDDTKGNEKVTIHGQYDMNTTVEHDMSDTVHNNRTITVDGTHTEKIKLDTTIEIIEGKLEHKVRASTADYYVEGALTETYKTTQDTTVHGNITIKSVGGKGEILIDAINKITLHTGASTLTMENNGTITLDGVNIKLIGSELIKSSAPTVEAAGGKIAKMAVGGQTVTCSAGKVETTGAAITASTPGIHEISGCLVKIN
jgi:type VI secretion system secreted protein VgrG